MLEHRQGRSKPQVEYIGIDVAEYAVQLAERNLAKLKDAGWAVRVINSEIGEVGPALVGGPVDLILAKDCLNHVDWDIANQCISDMRTVGSCVLMNQYPDMENDTRVRMGKAARWRRNNYSAHPFGLRLISTLIDGKFHSAWWNKGESFCVFDLGRLRSDYVSLGETRG